MSNLLSQASLVMIPSGYKEDVVYSQIPLDGSGDLQFTRSSNGTRINSAGLVEVCPWNLLPNSEVFSLWNTVLIGTTITVTDNFVTAPNGTLTAAKVVFSTFSDFAQLFQFYSLSTTQNLTATLYAKVPSGTKVCNFGFYDGAFKNQQKTLTTEWQRIEYTSSVDAGTVRACWFYGEGGASNVEVHLWGGQLNIGSTAKPYFPTTDRLNVPRLTYQNGGGGCPSLLLEKQSTNLVSYSEEFDNAAWNKYQCSISANQTTSPDGTQNADKLTLSGNSGTYTGLVYRIITTGANSIYMKNDSIGNGKFYIQVDGVGNAKWNTDGTLNSVTGGTATNGENMGNGWFRFTFVVTSGSYINYGIVDGTTGDSIYIWGAQLEASSYPTSYIPTTSSSATRVADACFKTGISSLIGQSEGVMFAEINVPSIATAGNYSSWQLNDGSTSNLIDFTYYSTGRIQAIAFIGGSLQVNIDLTSFGLTAGNHKIAFAYKLNDYVLYVDGVQVGSDTSAQVPAMSKCDLFTGSNQITIYNQFAVFPTRLTNAELASLTTI